MYGIGYLISCQFRLAKEAGGREKGKLSGPYISPNLHVEILPPTLQ